MAVQLMMKVKDWSTSRAGGGEITMMGEPAHQEHSIAECSLNYYN